MVSVNMFKTAFILLLLTAANISSANDIKYNFNKSTPVGSWQIRENIITNSKGKKSVNVIKTSLISKETRDNDQYYWVELEIDNFKLIKGKRKRDGVTNIIKLLIPERTLLHNMANVMQNARAYGKEVIIQNGDNEPMKLPDTSILENMKKRKTGSTPIFEFVYSGKESISIPAGSFFADKISGSSSFDSEVFMRKVTTKTRNTTWISKIVPFSTIKIVSKSINGNSVLKEESILVKYGKSGAKSKITKKPITLPQTQDDSTISDNK